MTVMIGVDPHKGSHTAVAIDTDELELAKVKVRASGRQLDELQQWAAPFEDRTWAIECAGGLGYLRLTAQILTERGMVERWSGFDQEPMLELHIDMGHTTTTASTRGRRLRKPRGARAMVAAVRRPWNSIPPRGNHRERAAVGQPRRARVQRRTWGEEEKSSTPTALST